jgi:hypothetical protein
VLCGSLSIAPSKTDAQTADQTLPPVTVEAPGAARAKPAAMKPRLSSASSRRSKRQLAATPNPTESTQSQTVTASVARGTLDQAPAGQTATTIDRSQFDNRPSFSVSDVLRDSPGISVKQGNGPRDFGISIRGSNARNGFAFGKAPHHGGMSSFSNARSTGGNSRIPGLSWASCPTLLCSFSNRSISAEFGRIIRLCGVFGSSRPIIASAAASRSSIGRDIVP